MRFFCDLCKYGTNHKNDYNKHLLTKKHSKNISSISSTNKNLEYICSICNQQFSSRSSLWRHTKSECSDNHLCKKITSVKQKKDKDSVNIEKMNTLLSDCLTTITKQSNTIQEQSSALKEQNKIILEQNNALKNIVPKIGNQTNNFNLHIYLNETCKNALSLQEFIKGISVELNDLIQARKTNLLSSTKEVFLKNLKETGSVYRPIQCTDIKRNTMYIKEEGEWNKDIGNKKLKTAITKLSHKYVSVVKDWKKKPTTIWIPKMGK